MIKRIFATFLQGLIVVIPVVFTSYVLYASMHWLDKSISDLFSDKTSTFPGMGIVVGCTLVYFIGLATRLYLFRNLVSGTESMIERLPLVKTLYSSVRDLLQFFNPSDSKPRGTPVRVRLSEDAHMLGIATNKTEGERVGVYFPLSYQIGGYLVYLPAERLKPLDLDVESTMKLIMTAGLSANSLESQIARIAPNRKEELTIEPDNDDQRTPSPLHGD
ncbi:MAG: DUF502 domain-containing protein [Myxococcota bacterium]|nr:DUF502 domain-containing protein [Myxococcota bacterium]